MSKDFKLQSHPARSSSHSALNFNQDWAIVKQQELFCRTKETEDQSKSQSAPNPRIGWPLKPCSTSESCFLALQAACYISTSTLLSNIIITICSLDLNLQLCADVECVYFESELVLWLDFQSSRQCYCCLFTATESAGNDQQ